MEESGRVRVWRDLPSVLWDVNSPRCGFFFFFFRFTLSQHSCQQENLKTSGFRFSDVGH